MTITLALVPARAGSKGVPGKNLRPVGGKPLLAHAIEVARKSPSVHRTVVSTDGDEIARVAREHGAEVPFLRPAGLARDDTPMLPVMEHAIRACEEAWGDRIDPLVLLHPTSPLRAVEDVEACVALVRSGACDLAVTARPARRSPHFNMVQDAGDGFARLVVPDVGVTRRQDAPAVFDLDTSVWAYSRAAILDERARLPRRTKVHVIPEERSIDLDTELDFLVLECLLAARRRST